MGLPWFTMVYHISYIIIIYHIYIYIYHCISLCHGAGGGPRNDGCIALQQKGSSTAPLVYRIYLGTIESWATGSREPPNRRSYMATLQMLGSLGRPSPCGCADSWYVSRNLFRICSEP